MPTIIPIERIQKSKQAADVCVHFGFCTAVCPTYVLDGEEKDSPRGRIALIKAMLEQGGKPEASTITHVDRCLSCLSCATTCAAEVDYRLLIDTAREYIEKSGARPLPEALTRKALAYIMTSPRTLSGLMKAGKPFAGLTARLPGILGALGRLSNAPGLHALAERKPSPSILPINTQAPIRKIALLDGCAQSVIGKEINDAARRVFNRLNVQVIKSDLAQECCGALNLHMGYEQNAAQQARALINDWYDKLNCQEIDAIIVTTSGCGSVIRHYSDLFTNDPITLERARYVENACLDITQFLMQLPLPTSDTLLHKAHLGAQVAYHDSCSLKHGQKISTEPRNLLKKLGFSVKEIAEGHLCCGSAGTYNILQPVIAERLGQRKANNIAATQPDIIAAGNMGCLVQISLYTDTPIAHVVQLTDWALGGPAPRGLESFTSKSTLLTPTQEENFWGHETADISETTNSLW